MTYRLQSVKWCVNCKTTYKSTSCGNCTSHSPDIIATCDTMMSVSNRTSPKRSSNHDNFIRIAENKETFVEDECLDNVFDGNSACDVPIYCCNDVVYDDIDINRFDSAMTTKLEEELDLIASKILETEEEYISSLESTVTSYKSCVKDVNSVAIHFNGDEHVLFDNIEGIYQFHKQTFFPQLKSFQRTPLEFGRCFLTCKQHFRIYTLHNKIKPRADQLWTDIFFRAKIGECNGTNSVDNSSYLVQPEQRLEEYAQFLRDLAYCCHSMDPRLQEINTAHALVEFHIRHPSDLEAMESIENADITLEEQGVLLRQHDFHVYYGHYGVIKRTRRVFLFEKAIVFTKIKKQKGEKDNYVYQHSIESESVGLTETIGKSDVKFEILYRKGKKGKLNDAYILQAPSASIKEYWTHDINLILSRNTLYKQLTPIISSNMDVISRTDTVDDIIDSKRRLSSGEFNENFVRENIYRRTTNYEPRRKAKPIWST